MQPTRLACNVDCHSRQRGPVVGGIRVVVEADDAQVTRHGLPALGQPRDETERHLVVRDDYGGSTADHGMDHV